MPIANVLAMGLGFVIAATGFLGIAAPSVLLEYGRLLQPAGALSVVATIRVVCGAILLWAAPNSRTPRTFRFLGILIFVAGLLTPFFGVERPHAAIDWWSTNGPFFTRAWPIAAVAFGLFIAYAALPRRAAT